MQRIAEHLEHGDSRAAIVVSTDPELLIAAYTDELDCVAMLRLPKEPLVSKYSLLRGSRLLTVNTLQYRIVVGARLFIVRKKILLHGLN